MVKALRIALEPIVKQDEMFTECHVWDADGIQIARVVPRYDPEGARFVVLRGQGFVGGDYKTLAQALDATLGACKRHDSNAPEVLAEARRRGLDVLPGFVHQHIVQQTEGQTKEPQARSVARGDLMGYSVTSVLRWMGVHGFSFQQARKVLTAHNCGSIADVTVRLQLKAGKDGQRGPAAPLNEGQSKQLKEMV